jgi:hypothetical protein
MSMTRRVLMSALPLFLVFALVANGADPKSPKPPLTEAQVLNLIESQIDDSAIIDRIRQGGGPGPWVNDEAIKRLKGAGASGAVLQFLQPVRTDDKAPVPADDPDRERLAVFVTKLFSRDSGLKSELRINGNLVGEFSSDTSAPVGKFVKMGWNTITLKSSAVPDVKSVNHLSFTIGPVSKKSKGEAEVMDWAVWQFDNTNDWQDKNGVVTHVSKPGAKEVTLTFRLFYAGTSRENHKLTEGDYILKHAQLFSRAPHLTTTVFVNGHPVTTFLGSPDSRAHVVITPFLTKGRNEVRMVADGVTNMLIENDLSIEVLGPAEYSAVKRQFLLKPVLKFHSHEGWQRDEKSGLWHAPGKPGVTRHERTFTFDLAEKPMTK